MRVAPASRGGIPFGALAALVVLYFAAPGHRELAVHGVPLGPEGTAIVAAAVVLGVVFRNERGQLAFIKQGLAGRDRFARKLIVELSD